MCRSYHHPAFRHAPSEVSRIDNRSRPPSKGRLILVAASRSTPLQLLDGRSQYSPCSHPEELPLTTAADGESTTIAALLGWDHTRSIRAGGCHSPTGGTGSQAQGQSNSLSRHTGAEPPMAWGSHPGQTWQRSEPNRQY